MSKLNDLIYELCPNGVEFKTLGELGSLYGGLSGKSKEDFKVGNATFITYMNVYSNPALKIDVIDKVRIGENERQNTVEYGDVLLTGSSETPDECGMSSVLTTKTDEKLYLNSFCMGYRLSDKSKFIPDFLKHLFRSEELRKQLIKTASGVTRYNVSKDKVKKVRIPVPPIEVQREIVRILDNFTELTAELTARKKQYEYYRNLLLNSDQPLDDVLDDSNKQEVKWLPLGEVADIYDGTHQTPKYTTEGVKFVSVENINNLYETTKYISRLDYEKNYKIKPKPGDVFMTRIGSIGVCTVVEQNIDLAYYVTLTLIRPKASVVNGRYLKYIIESDMGQSELKKRTLVYATPIKINLGDVGKILLPIPPLEEQERIVAILDKFSALTTDLTDGLPAEIEARKKQYEYYRNTLLNFGKPLDTENTLTAKHRGGGT